MTERYAAEREARRLACAEREPAEGLPSPDAPTGESPDDSPPARAPWKPTGRGPIPFPTEGYETPPDA